MIAGQGRAWKHPDRDRSSAAPCFRSGQYSSALPSRTWYLEAITRHWRHPSSFGSCVVTYHGGEGLHLDWTMVREYDCVELYLYVIGPPMAYIVGRLLPVTARGRSPDRSTTHVTRQRRVLRSGPRRGPVERAPDGMASTPDADVSPVAVDGRRNWPQEAG